MSDSESLALLKQVRDRLAGAPLSRGMCFREPNGIVHYNPDALLRGLLELRGRDDQGEREALRGVLQPLGMTSLTEFMAREATTRADVVAVFDTAIAKLENGAEKAGARRGV